MALQVLNMSDESGKPQVTLTSDKRPHSLAISELQGADARRLAIKFASSRGITNARCEMPSAPYPVDPAGEPVADPLKQKIDSYRIDVPISTGM